MFLALFQKNVIPTADEQARYIRKKDMQQIQEKLSGLPQYGNFSLANPGPGLSDAGGKRVRADAPDTERPAEQ